MTYLNRNNQSGQDKVYACPMHSEIKRDRPGMCPECGMNLVPEKKKISKIMTPEISTPATASLCLLVEAAA